MIILLGFSFLAGLVTVLSPCILPILPLLLSSGFGASKLRPLGIIIGLVTSFTFFTLSLGPLVRLTGISPDFLRYTAIALICLFGLTMIFPALAKRFEQFLHGFALLGRRLEGQHSTTGDGFWSGIILGNSLGLIWTPCAGPILASIIVLVAVSSVTWHTILITLVYSIGAALPMFLIMLGANKILWVTAYTHIIRKIFGILMIVGALAIALHYDIVLQQFAVRFFPVLTFEDNEMVRKELEALQSESGNSKSNGNPPLRAPEITGIIQWLNAEPLTLKELRGKVVLIDFWTYSCINCVRTFPYVKKWYEKYKDQGFVLIGIHTPEFEFEKNVENVKAAIKRFGITYPVAMDNDYKTWRAYSNRYWPAHYLIDKQGYIKYTHFGEGAYDKTENMIRRLLGLDKTTESVSEQSRKRQTPEIYLGYQRAHNYLSELSITFDKTKDYSYSVELADDQIGLKGMWSVGSQYIKAQGDDCQLEINFLAGKVFLVMKSEKSQQLTVLIGGETAPSKYNTPDMKDGKLPVQEARMYHILDLSDEYGRHLLGLKIPKGVELYAFTFGS